MASIYSEGQGEKRRCAQQYEKEKEKKTENAAQSAGDFNKFLKKLEDLEGMPIVGLFLSEEERSVRQVP